MSLWCTALLSVLALVPAAGVSGANHESCAEDPTGATCSRDPGGDLVGATDSEMPSLVQTLYRQKSRQRSGSSPWTAKNPNPDLFKWIGDVKDGEKNCGYLTAPVSYQPGYDGAGYPFLGGPDSEYPGVFFCIKFAPEPSNLTLFRHCGGPGSAANCLFTDESTSLGREAWSKYNIVAASQRGIGSSLPSFDEACNKYYAEFCAWMGSGGNCGAEWISDRPFNPLNETEVKVAARLAGEAVYQCFKDKVWDFPSPSGTIHFLQNSGSQTFANDINRFREAIGAEKLSFYGVSYGTVVTATFASLFPDRVDKFIINGIVNSDPNSEVYSNFKAVTMQTYSDALITLCHHTPDCPWLQKEGMGAVDLHQAHAEVMAMTPFEFDMPTYDINETADASAKACMEKLSGTHQVLDWTFFMLPNGAYGCQTRKYLGALDQSANFIFAVSLPAGKSQQSKEAGFLAAAQSYELQSCVATVGEPTPAPTPPAPPPPAPPPPMNRSLPDWEGESNTAAMLVNGQDRSGSYQSSVILLDNWNIAKSKFGVPAVNEWLNQVLGVYQFPLGPTLAFMGNPDKQGIIIGDALDGNTGYAMSQQMKTGFGNTRFVTGQFQCHSTEVVLGDNYTDCSYGYKFMEQCNDRTTNAYLLNGTLPQDGTTCTSSAVPPLTQSLVEKNMMKMDELNYGVYGENCAR